VTHRCTARPEGQRGGGCWLPKDDDEAAERELEAEALDARTIEERLEEGFQLIGGTNAA